MAKFPIVSQQLMEKFMQTGDDDEHEPNFQYASILENIIDLSPSEPDESESLVGQWLESIPGSDISPERGRRPDTSLGDLVGDIVLRGLTPTMDYIRNTDGFVVPPTPNSTGSHSFRANMSWNGSAAASDFSGSSTGSSRRSLVENPLYRDNNLAENNIFLRSSREQFPKHIADLVDKARKDRGYPGPSLDQVLQDMNLEDLEMGTGESRVEAYFKTMIFPEPPAVDSLKRINKSPMAKHTVPSVGSTLKVSTPVPDMLYGYNRLGAFPRQQAQLRSMGNGIAANTQDLLFPFFVVEFKADGPRGSGSMWVATNQCLGGSATCVNIVEHINSQLSHCHSDTIRPINSAVFSIAMNGTEARLFISWKHDELKYHMQKVRSFLLQEPEQYVEFFKYVHNIIDWGKDARLREIQKSLDCLFEESKVEGSQLGKPWPSPSHDTAGGRSQKRKGSISRGRNSRAKSVQRSPGGRDIAPSSPNN
ncbi:MAG: hypothetical protein M1829_003896 [Trizodia sp. TS-e1964]|nr:MAG: hypothetical protein M1829_003896 [Trizodia sp. TS-e1964]